MSNQIELTNVEYASIDARGARIHYGSCSIRREGSTYIMASTTGSHQLDRDVTDLSRLNAHWVGFVVNHVRKVRAEA